MSFIRKIRTAYNAVMLSTGNVGKNILNTSTDSSLLDNTAEVKVQYSLAEALLNGVVTKEVESLRAQYYMVTDRMSNMSIEIEYDANGDILLNSEGQPTYKIKQKYEFLKLKKVKTDNNDTEYPLVGQILNDTFCDKMVFDKLRAMIYKFEVSTDGLDVKPIRDISKFAHKVLIRDISNTESLLEFYFPEVDWELESDKNYKLFIKMLNNTNINQVNNLIGFESFSFVSDVNDLGVGNGRVFLFNSPKPHRISKVGDNTVVKFKVVKEIYDMPSGFEHITDEMVAKYENFEPRIDKNGTGKSNIGL